MENKIIHNLVIKGFFKEKLLKNKIKRKNQFSTYII